MKIKERVALDNNQGSARTAYKQRVILGRWRVLRKLDIRWCRKNITV